MLKQIKEQGEKKAIAREILENLPEWFGIPEAREEYILESEKQIFFAAFKKHKAVGFLCVKETNKDCAELAVMGILKDYQREGIGKALFHAAKDYAVKEGYSFIQVKTVQMGCYAEYDETNKFYIHVGFKELEVFPMLWDQHNPCQIYIMAL